MKHNQPKVWFRDNNINTIIKGLEIPQVKQIVFDKSFPILKEAILKNKKSCSICVIGNDFEVIIMQNNYNNVLKSLENYYIEKEDWNKCIELRDLAK